MQILLDCMQWIFVPYWWQSLSIAAFNYIFGKALMKALKREEREPLVQRFLIKCVWRAVNDMTFRHIYIYISDIYIVVCHIWPTTTSVVVGRQWLIRQMVMQTLPSCIHRSRKIWLILTCHYNLQYIGT